MSILIETDRLRIVPFEMGHLQAYFSEFGTEITRYQYPEPFASISAAGEQLGEFIGRMNRDEMLFLSILAPDGAFAGGVEVHGLREECPEVGVWIKKRAQRRGYAYEALAGVLRYTDEAYRKGWYVYEADVRNVGSMKLVERFDYRKDGYDEFETETGKLLKLQRFLIRNKR